MEQPPRPSPLTIAAIRMAQHVLEARRERNRVIRILADRVRRAEAEERRR